MRIHRVYIGAELVVGEEITLDKAQGHYLKKVLRLKSGAAFFLFNGREAIDYRARLVVDGKKVAASIDAAINLDTESGLESIVIQGLGRSDHMDWMIQKTTELGVSKILIFNAERTQAPLKASQVEKKHAHWRAVATSACEQCGRAILPETAFYGNLEQALAATEAALGLLLDFDGDPLVGALQAQSPSVSILLGPEGGLNPQEIELARSRGFRPVSLGRRVLRTETAATAALAICQSALGDLS